MRLTLIVRGGAFAGREIRVLHLPFFIGRAEGCHLRAASPSMSKRHAALLFHDGHVHVRDLGGTNGTVVDGEVVHGGEAVVRDGCLLELGGLKLAVRLSGDAPPAPPTPKTPPALPAPQEPAWPEERPEEPPAVHDASWAAAQLLKSLLRKTRHDGWDWHRQGPGPAGTEGQSA
jgi:hypothetical protein